MANVNIKFNNKDYLLSCDDGQEENLKELANHLDEKYNQLKKNLGNIGESKILLITAIQMVDDYFDLSKKIDSKKSDFEKLSIKFKELRSLAVNYKDEKEKEIENQIISCSSVERKIDVDEEDLVSGENELMFEIDKGDYLFRKIELETETNSKGYISYKFSITENEYDDIMDEDREAILFLDFNDREDKRATVSINGNEFTLDTDDVDYERDISRLIDEGTNFIRIYPEVEFNIDLLKITLEE